MIANALYFNASWASGFADPTPQSFTDRNGAATPIPMLNQDTMYPYTSGNGYQAVLVPYADEDLALLAIVPTLGMFDAFVSSLTGAKLVEMLDGMMDTQVNLTFPTMHIEELYELTSALESLGMRSAFGASADFGHMTSAPAGVHVSAVLHKTMTDITKEGTIATSRRHRRPADERQ